MKSPLPKLLHASTPECQRSFMPTLFLSVLDNIKKINLDLLQKEDEHDGRGTNEGQDIKERLRQHGFIRKLGPRGRIRIEASSFLAQSPLELQRRPNSIYKSVRACNRSFALCAAYHVRVCTRARMQAHVQCSLLHARVQVLQVCACGVRPIGPEVMSVVNTAVSTPYAKMYMFSLWSIAQAMARS